MSTSKRIQSQASTDQTFKDRPEKTGVKWAAVVLLALAVGSLGAAGYFGGLAHHAGTNILQSSAFKASLIAGGSMLALGISFLAISKTHNKASNLASGILESRIFTPFALAGLAVAGLYAISVLGFGVEPHAWMIGASVAGGFALGIVGLLPFNGKQKIEFELSALRRLCQKENYNQIFETSKNSKLYLGALPNMLQNDGQTLRDVEGIDVVLSINEPWERSSLGLSVPYDARDWEEVMIDYKEMDVLDHSFLDNVSLHQAADFINDQLNNGQNVYVHCRAGVGRSAMAVAAYLIKYVYKDKKDEKVKAPFETPAERGPVNKACRVILEGRNISTICKKIPALNAFTDDCRAKRKGK